MRKQRGHLTRISVAVIISTILLLTDAYLLLTNSITNIQWTIAQNITLMAAVVTLIAFYFPRLKQVPTKSPQWWLILGIVCNAVGYLIHRTYFTVFRAAEGKGYTELAAYMLGNSWVVFGGILIIVLGTSFHMHEWLIAKCGKRWWWIYLTGALIIFNIGLLIG